MSITRKNLASPLRGIVIAAVSLAAPLQASAQVILNVSEEVRPGEPFTLVGHDLRSTDEFMVSRLDRTGTISPGQPCEVKALTDSTAILRPPADLPAGLWQVRIKRNSAWGPPTYINRVRVAAVDTDIFKPGDSIRILGRNLVSTEGGRPTVYFVAPDGTRLVAAMNSFSKYSLMITAPSAAVPGQTYQLAIDNMNGPTSLSYVTKMWTLKATEAVSDGLALKVPWSGRFEQISQNTYNIKTDSRLAVKAVGDGVADDTDAVQDAINVIERSGGGILYFPEGTYNLDGEVRRGYRATIDLRPNVVLKGAGMGVSTLRFGMKYSNANPPPSNAAWMSIYEGGGNGIWNLSVINMNRSSTPNRTIRRGSGENDTCFEFFIKAVELRMNNGMALAFDSTTRGLISNCRIIYTSTVNGPIDLAGSRWIRFNANEVYYRVGRIRAIQMSDSQLVGNGFYRDMVYAVPGYRETGGIETSYSRRTLIAGNKVIGVGELSTRGTIDGEMIMSQRSNVPDFQWEAQVTEADSTTLTDLNSAWQDAPWQSVNHRGPNRMLVAIVSGKGRGQWRWIASREGQTITIDQPWKVIPDATSTYTISSMTNYQQFILGNTITNGTSSISLYSGGIDSVVSGNRITDGGPLIIRGHRRAVDSPSSSMSVDLAWYTVTDENYVVNTLGGAPAAISVVGVAMQPSGDFSLLMGNEVRRNRIDLKTELKTYAFQVASKDGYWNQYLPTNGPTQDNANIGSVFSGNVAYGTTNVLNIRNVVFYFFQL